ncbi:MAG: glycoside hydrolase family 31 protein [Acidimicrobiales bacterium]
MAVALVAVAVLAAACTGDAAAPPATSAAPPTGASAAPAATPRFDAVQTQGDGVVRISADGYEIAITPQPFAVEARRPGESTPFLGPSAGDPRSSTDPVCPCGGLFVVRDGGPIHVLRGEVESADPAGVRLRVTLRDGSTGTVSVTPDVGGSAKVTVRPDDPAGVTAWGHAAATTPDEAVYGLTERIVDDRVASEIVPVEAGSLDRKGEQVTMYVTPTMSGYAPFSQSSLGYGLLVDGTMPGTYDVGATDPATVSFRFELDPQVQAGSFHLFGGPGPAKVLDAYTQLTGRPTTVPDTVFTTWRGRDEYRKGATAEWRGLTINADVARDLNAYDRYGIPPGIFHFDRPWAVGQEGYGELRFDPERFPNAEQMLAAMRDAGWHIQVWVAPWAIGTLGDEARANGYLAPGSTRAIDLTDPDAVAWLQGKVEAFLAGPEGRYVDGFFMDRGDEPDVPSAATDVYADGRNGRQVHNDYPVLYARTFAEAMRRARPDGSGWLIERPAYTGSQASVMRWGGDSPSREGITVPEVPNTGPSTDLGLRAVIISMQRAAFMGTTYWGSDIGGYSPWIDRDLYARWIQVGAASPLMRFHGQGPAPWDVNADGTVDQELLEIYERYVDLHRALGPELRRLADEAQATGLPIVRPLVFSWPDDPSARTRWDEWTIGPDVLVAPVWRSGQRSREVWFPPGRWTSVWDPSTVIEGPATTTVDVPLDVLPMYAREGSTAQTDVRAVSTRG